MKRCGLKRKKKHVDAAAAYATLRPGERMRAYDCPSCGYWHLTSQLAPELRLRGRDAA